MQKIGAQVRYNECSGRVSNQFALTGDDARSFVPQLAGLANKGMKILVWVRSSLQDIAELEVLTSCLKAGDADIK